MPGTVQPLVANFTQYPNVLMDRFQPLLSASAFGVLSVIVRQTYGWHMAERQIALSELALRSGLAKATVRASLSELTSCGLLGSRRETREDGGDEASAFWLKTEATEEELQAMLGILRRKRLPSGGRGPESAPPPIQNPDPPRVQNVGPLSMKERESYVKKAAAACGTEDMAACSVEGDAAAACNTHEERDGTTDEARSLLASKRVEPAKGHAPAGGLPVPQALLVLVGFSRSDALRIAAKAPSPLTEEHVLGWIVRARRRVDEGRARDFHGFLRSMLQEGAPLSTAPKRSAPKIAEYHPPAGVCENIVPDQGVLSPLAEEPLLADWLATHRSWKQEGPRDATNGDRSQEYFAIRETMKRRSQEARAHLTGGKTR